MKKQLLRGVFSPMITPFTQSGDIDYDAFAYNIDRWNDTDLAGYVVLSSNSENTYLDTDERLTLVQMTIRTAQKGKYIMVNTSLDSVQETIWMTNKVATLGAHFALVQIPGSRVSDAASPAVEDYCMQIADQSDIPVLFRCERMPSCAGLNSDVIARFCAHPKILGIASALDDVSRLSALPRTSDSGFNALPGTIASWYTAMDKGVSAAILSLANCCPEACTELQDLFIAGNRDEADALFQRLNEVDVALRTAYGIRGLKYISFLMGYNGGFMREPQKNITEPEKNTLRVMMEDAHFLKKEMSSVQI